MNQQTAPFTFGHKTPHGREPNVQQLDLRDTQILENPPILARYFAFQYKSSNQTQIVLYWFETSTLILNDTLEQKQVKISLISYPHSQQEIEETENNLMNFAIAIAGHWQPTKTWTQIALIISKNGLALSTISATLTACMIMLSALDIVRRRKTITRTYSKLPTNANANTATVSPRLSLPKNRQNKRDIVGEIGLLDTMLSSLVEILEEKGILATEEWEKRIKQRTTI